jgi:hypothetical protein
MKRYHTDMSTFASRISPNTDQRLQKRLHLSYPGNFEVKKISFLSENEKYDNAQTVTTKTVVPQTQKTLTEKRLKHLVDRRPACNSTCRKGGGSCSKDSFVVNQTLVFQIKFCSKSPALRVAAKR